MAGSGVNYDVEFEQVLNKNYKHLGKGFIIGYFAYDQAKCK